MLRISVINFFFGKKKQKTSISKPVLYPSDFPPHICIPMKTLTIKEAKELLYTGDWLHIVSINADIEKGKGGTVMNLPKARVILHSDKPASTGTHSDRDSKAQNHHENVTVNVELPNRHTRKIHLPLILSINSVPVI